MATIKTIRNGNYTTMCNYHLKDKNLSLKAKGLLTMMLSLPDEWHYSVKGLSNICKESENTINGILNELEENNYLVRRRKYVNGKISEWEYLIFETNENHDEELLHLKNQDVENQDVENVDVENLHLENLHLQNCDAYKITKRTNTKELNIKELKEKNNKKEKSKPSKCEKKPKQKETMESIVETYSQDDELLDALRGFVEMRKKQKKPLTLHALKLNLKTLDGLAVDDHTKAAIVNQSIEHSWLTFYALKNNQAAGFKTREEMGYAF